MHVRPDEYVARTVPGYGTRVEGDWPTEHGGVITEWERAIAVIGREYHELVSRGSWVSGPSDFFSIIERAEDERDAFTNARMASDAH